jgi:hypothetical protein
MYIDLYFLIKNHFSIGEIVAEADKLFREQLAFHKDINYAEEVEFMDGYQIGQEEIKIFLIDKALDWQL